MAVANKRETVLCVINQSGCNKPGETVASGNRGIINVAPTNLFLLSVMSGEDVVSRPNSYSTLGSSGNVQGSALHGY